MVRYLAENNIQDVADICQFDMEEYQLVESKVSDGAVIVFDRPKQAAVQPKKKKKPASIKKAAVSDKKKTRSKK